MLKKFLMWFIAFGLSFLVESLGWAEQGKAFLFIYFASDVLIIALLILVCLFAGDGLGERIGFPVIVAVVYGAIIAIILFATWGATKLFNVDYYVAFQIMTFGLCLCPKNEKDWIVNTF